MTTTQPRYQQIKQFISAAIRSGDYKPGERIPTEAKLSAQFAVSRMTVNKALRDLMQEGLLSRHPGLGTFVSDVKAESPLADIRNIAEEVRLRGHKYSNRIIKLEAQQACETLALRLGIPAHSRVFHSEIVHLENGVPIQLEARYVVADAVPQYLAQDFSRITPNYYLSSTCPVSAIEHTVEAIVPDARSQQLLALKTTLPCLQVSRRTWSAGRLISFALLTHPGDRYKLRSIVNFTSI